MSFFRHIRVWAARRARLAALPRACRNADELVAWFDGFCQACREARS